MHYKLILYSILISFFTQTYAQNQLDLYKPLTRKEKRDFQNAYIAVSKADTEHNNEAIHTFAPAIIENFKSIMLDPSAKRLRDKYQYIKQVYNESKIIVEKSALIHTIQKSSVENAISLYQKLFPLLKTQEEINAHRVTLDSLTKCFIETKQSVNKIIHLPYINKHLIKNVVQEEQQEIANSFANLSLSLDYKKILSFGNKYPDYKPQQVAVLLEKAQGESRKSLLRNMDIDQYIMYKNQFPSVDKQLDVKAEKFCKYFIMKRSDVELFSTYLQLFGDKDIRFLQEFEKKLFADIVNAPDTQKVIDHAIKYLCMFPQGQFAPQVQSFISQNTQQHLLQVNQDYATHEE